MKQYQKEVNILLTDYKTDSKLGLSNEKASKLIQEFGTNTFEESKKESFFKKIMSHMKDITTIILLIAAGISIFTTDYIEAVVILSIVIINALLGAIQESNAEKALESLQNINKHTCNVIRDGQIINISSEDVVPGDMLVLETGDRVSADGRILESYNLKVDESFLTGESEQILKDELFISDKDIPLGDRLNMVFSGSLVSAGRANVLVTETGMRTEMGKIAELLNNEKSSKTPLQAKLTKLGKNISFIAILAAIIVFAIGFVQQEPMLEMFMNAISLAVAAVPETLMVIVTLSLSHGVKNMVKRNALVRKLPAVETLGSTSVICSDKTGTLTQNKMTAVRVWSGKESATNVANNMDKDDLNILKLATLCSNAQVDNENKSEIGDPTEIAIVRLWQENEVNKNDLDDKYKKIGEIPFSSDRKMMTTVHKYGDKYISITKGAFDRINPLCIKGDIKKAEKINHDLGKEAMRVIAVSCKILDEEPTEYISENLESDIELLGLIGIIDPPRPESKISVQRAKDAGIKTVMITGDHIVTACAIAKEIGILNDESEAMTGQELSNLTDKELIDCVKDYSVYARVSPEDKIRIVKAWQSNGEVVAMTGDGVNDAPALKAADVGCAMGITGTDVAKGASDMVLTDDNFATIIDAVEEGRTVYNNIKKTVNFLLSCNVSEIFIVLISMILGFGVPVVAIQLLFINVVADGLPGFALSLEKSGKNMMNKKPIKRGQSIFADGLWIKIAINSAMFTIVTLIGFYIGYFVQINPNVLPSKQVGQTMAFLILGFSSVVHVFNCRSEESIFKIGITSNKRLLQMFVLSTVIIISTTLFEPLRNAFYLVPISAAHWQLLILLSILPVVFTEIFKLGLVNKCIDILPFNRVEAK